MDDSKTVSIINKFYSIVENSEPTIEDRDFIKFYQFSLAQAISEEFGQDSVKIAKMLLAYNE